MVVRLFSELRNNTIIPIKVGDYQFCDSNKKNGEITEQHAMLDQ
jgi:hypothetical protein